MNDHGANTSVAGSPLGLFDRAARRLVARQLRTLGRGTVSMCDAAGTQHFGESAELHAEIQVHRPRFFRQAVLGGKLSIAESYLQGDWDCDNLTDLFRIFARNQTVNRTMGSGIAKIFDVGHRLYHRLRANTRSGSRRNIADHYDLGNDFYRLWLDETLAYSCGIFATPDATLNEASVEKFDRVCRKLSIDETQHVVEIGTGWGGFAIHAAQLYGCNITTTTISSEQHAIARQRIDESGCASRVTLLQQDYRDLQGQFDKLVSIEMIEAVGHRFLDQYFERCGQLLRPSGSMVLQAIVAPERGYADYLRSVDFIQRYVFPGGCLPTFGAILESAGRTTDLRFVHAEDFAPHYAETLRRWRNAFQERIAAVRELGYSETFIRLWNYYLCYCEAAFEERCVGVIQVQLDKPGCRRDPLDLSFHAADTQHKNRDLLRSQLESAI